jgi:hypothetical protein
MNWTAALLLAGFFVLPCRGESQTLTATQRADLSHQLEEEKMARDLYQEFYRLWGMRKFVNIAGSEERHLEALVRIHEYYSISLPVSFHQPGVFDSEEISKLYQTLKDKGAGSLAGAIQVGVDVEMKDIADLREAIGRAPADIMPILENLLAASYRHLAAFQRG